MAMKSIDAIRNYLKDGNVVIESLYSWEEFKYLKNEFGTGIKLLTVYTTKELRYKRLSEREFRPLTNQQAVSRDISEIENLDKGGPIAYSDYLVINDSGLTELKNNLKKYI
jgi:dephospho-CoA kinase